MLVLDSHRGSASWPGENFLLTPKVDLRGHAVPDIMHRRNDGIANAFKAARCQAVQCEGVILFGFFKGAFWPELKLLYPETSVHAMVESK